MIKRWITDKQTNKMVYFDIDLNNIRDEFKNEFSDIIWNKNKRYKYSCALSKEIRSFFKELKTIKRDDFILGRFLIVNIDGWKHKVKFSKQNNEYITQWIVSNGIISDSITETGWDTTIHRGIIADRIRRFHEIEDPYKEIEENVSQETETKIELNGIDDRDIYEWCAEYESK